MGTRTVPSYAGGWAVPGFTEQRELGRGTAGRVAEAVHDGSGCRVAIKYLSAALVGDPAFMRRFRAEARALRELRAPQVVQVHDFVEQAGVGAAVISELVDGVSLREMIERRGPVGPEAALTAFKGTLLALAAAHAAGIGHRDCKPENVLVDAAGNSKLADFGWAVRNGERRPPAGMPPYLAPELWRGTGESPVTDLYAATAVFFFCLAGEPPFTGTAAQLREQHATAAVPAELADPPLRRLIVRGMAKDPAQRPQSAIAFAAELEALAASAYGPGWEERGRGQLAERAAALLPLPSRARPARAQSRPHTPARAASSDGRRQLVVIAAVAAAAVVLIGGVAAAVTLKGKLPGHKTANLSSTSSPGRPAAPSFSAVADVTPPVAASKCTTATTFTYSGTLSATVPGTVTYRWVYSAGKPGPEQTVSFTAAGDRRVTGETVRTKTAGAGWGKLEVISPVARTSNKASYKLLCGGGSVGGITATATVAPSARTVSCVTAPPAFTAAGSVRASKAEQVTYYWARSDGANSAPETLTFAGPGAKAVQPLTITPPRASGSGQAVLVVISPVTTASSPAAYTLTCKAPTASTTSPTATSHTAPATAPAGAGDTSGQALTLTNDALTSATVGETYSGTVSVSGGQGPYTWAPVSQLPTGLVATADGSTLTLSGTLDEGGNFPLQLSVHDSSTPQRTATERLTVNITVPLPQPVMALSGTLSYDGNLSHDVSDGIIVQGGKFPYAWSFTGLPAWLTTSTQGNGSSLSITGTPAAAGTFTFTATVQDAEKPPQSITNTYTITIAPKSWNILTPDLPGGTVGTPYTATIEGTPGVTITWSASGLPPGLSFDPATATISGTPTQTAFVSVAVTATVTQPGAGTQSATAHYNLSIDPAPA